MQSLPDNEGRLEVLRVRWAQKRKERLAEEGEGRAEAASLCRRRYISIKLWPIWCSKLQQAGHTAEQASARQQHAESGQLVVGSRQQQAACSKLKPSRSSRRQARLQRAGWARRSSNSSRSTWVRKRAVKQSRVVLIEIFLYSASAFQFYHSKKTLWN